MRLYHRPPNEEIAQAILDEGFRDGHGTYLTKREMEGVFFADRPGLGNETDRPTIEVEVPDGVAEQHEMPEPGKPYREFCIPADVVNRFARSRWIDDGGPLPLPD